MSSRTYEALLNLVSVEFDKLQASINASVQQARKAAGTEDQFDVTLALANKLTLYGVRMAAGLHNNSLDNSRVREPPEQLELPFPSN